MNSPATHSGQLGQSGPTGPLLDDISALSLRTSACNGTAGSVPTLKGEHGATSLSLQRGV